MIALLYMALALLATATPVFVIGRVDAVGEIANSGTVVLGSVFIAPSCVAAYAWILIQNFKHVERERDMPIRAAVRKLRCGESMPKAPNDLKLDRMRRHVASQLVLTLALVAVGMGYAAYVATF